MVKTPTCAQHRNSMQVFSCTGIQVLGSALKHANTVEVYRGLWAVLP